MDHHKGDSLVQTQISIVRPTQKMEFSKNFKAGWWGILIISIGYYLASRLPDLQAGDPTWFDALVFVIWMAVALGPFFKEMEIFGLKFKQEVAKLKEQVSSELQAIRTTVSSVNEQRQNSSSSINFGYVPLDSQLDNVKEQISAAVAEALGSSTQIKDTSPNTGIPKINEDTQYLFSARLAIENALRNIETPKITDDPKRRRFAPIHKIVDNLVVNGRITYEIGAAIREVYSVCSLAVHGEDVTPAKVDFVRTTAPQLLSALKFISEREAADIFNSAVLNAHQANIVSPF